MNSETVILRDLTTGYASGNHSVKTVTENINASLRAGELTCLLGPNGAGKSTLLKTLSATLPPLSGSLELLGRSIEDYSAAELAKATGIVLTDRPTQELLTAEELVGLGRSPYTGFFGRLSSDDRAIVADAIEAVGAGDLAHRAVSTLSDGERQKVMIAKVLAQQTPVILLDEPTAFLDYPSKVEIMVLLRKLCATKGKTVFLSTHDLDLALMIADRLWLLRKKAPLVTGTPEDLALDGSLEQCFSGRGVGFDRATGLFNVESDYTSTLSVSGSGQRTAMVCKALRRKGINPVIAEKETDADIEVSADSYIFKGKAYTTIEALLEAVKA